MKRQSAFLCVAVLWFVASELQSQDSRPQTEKPVPKALQPKIDVRGKMLTLSQLKNSAKRLPTKTIETPKDGVIGMSVLLEGTVSDTGAGIVLLVERPNKTQFPVEIDDTNLDEESRQRLSKPGRVARVVGLIDGPAKVAGYAAELYPPSIQWKHALRMPDRVVAGTDQDFFIDVVVKNTGKQQLRNIQAACRVWQDESPNDDIDALKVGDLAPGQSKNFTLKFNLYNFQYIGKTSVPKCAFAIVDFDH